MHEVIRVAPDSPVFGKVKPGEYLASINGNQIRDVLDYEFYSYDANPLLNLKTRDGQWKMMRVKKEEGEDLGLTFKTYLMDKPRSCVNRCIFCFIDQLPSGLRESLYFKDDDVRLSFLTGNYVSLTNLSGAEIERLIALRVSPINVSIHATDPEVRAMMLGNPRGGQGLELMYRFAQEGMMLNAQIVVCPGINDGQVLEQTMEDLKALYPALQSVSVVPVGLTKYRDGLYPLAPFTPEIAFDTISQVEGFAAQCLEELGSRLFFLADELYLQAGIPLPDEDDYEGYPQIENGVGMLRHFKETLLEAIRTRYFTKTPASFSIATGEAAAPFLHNLVTTVAQKYGKLDGQVHAIRNDFFGPDVNVAGLVTGGDILAQLYGQNLGERLFIPRTMLRHGEEVFLDNMTVTRLTKQLGIPVIPVDPDGQALLEAIFS